jgi:adenylylsulfate kinase
MKILIMGLSGSGKTFLSKLLQKELSCAWYNADSLREMANDWDFSDEGRKRQSLRMKSLADFEKENGRLVICDFICPTRQSREIFDADFCIWMDTIRESKYKDTDKIFEQPEKFNLKISKWDQYSPKEVANLIRDV